MTTCDPRRTGRRSSPASRACQELGMVVWLYDEEGYPSGAAGGLVLKRESCQFEALALAWDPSQPDPFFVRRAYEHTHASNNYYAARRYINLIDDRAARSFISHTHDELLPATEAVLRPDHPGHVHRRALAHRREPRPDPRGGPQRGPRGRPDRSGGSAAPRGAVGATTCTKQYKKRYGEDLIAPAQEPV